MVEFWDFCEKYGDDNDGWLLMERYNETYDDSDNDDNFDNVIDDEENYDQQLRGQWGELKMRIVVAEASG